MGRARLAFLPVGRERFRGERSQPASRIALTALVSRQPDGNEDSRAGERLGKTMNPRTELDGSQLTPSDALGKSRGTMPFPERSSWFSIWLSIGLGSAALLATQEVRGAGNAGNRGNAGSITGKVLLAGKAPPAATLNMRADPFCAKQPPVKDDEIAVGADQGLKNVVVRIAKGVANPPPAPSSPAVVDQNGCRYLPRVLVVQAGQTLEIRNSDSTLHNIHTYKGTATLFNLAHIQGAPPFKKKFPTVGDVVKFKCDVHPWMTGWVLVTDNPYHAVSGADGSFTIADVPAGQYTVEIWHEKLGSQTRDVTVSDGKPVELKLEFKAK
jgi:plastocyanin